LLDIGKMQRLHNNIKQAQKFKKFRPSYPASLYESIYEYLASGGGAQDTAVDVSCGTVGERSTSPLTSTFGRVIAVDVKKAQADQVRKNGNSSPKQMYFGQSTDLSFLRSGTVDLVTVSQAYHWLDRERFLRQVNDALAPNGVLAVHGYGNLTTDNPDVSAIIFQYYTETLRGYWESERRHVDNEYKHFTLPLSDFTRRAGFRIEKTWPLSGLVGYLSTQTASRVFIEKNGLGELEKIYDNLRDIYNYKGDSNGEPTINITWPTFLLLGRKV